MPLISIPTVLQVIVGLGLLNVWLIRAASATAYRGGAAKTIKEEFAAYGLPNAAMYVV
ncbi:DoxX family protein, partial [bacterium]|nr:DoxX family protein [bacterium]